MERLTKLLLYATFCGTLILFFIAYVPGEKMEFLTNLLLYAIPSVFFLAVIARTIQVAIDSFLNQTRDHIPTEPIVLMTLGFAFLYINAPFVTVPAKMADIQFRAVCPDLELPYIDEVFAFAAYSLLASFAKVFWTHLNLEEGQWGPPQHYRANFRGNWKITVPEFILRVGIAIAVVLLQKTIAGIEALPGAEMAASWSFKNDADSADFLFAYQKWVGHMSDCATIFFILILIWLSVAFCNNFSENRTRIEFWFAVIGTLSFAFPGLILCVALRYMVTGSFFYSYDNDPPDFQAMMISTGLIALSGILILVNMLFTLIQTRSTFRACINSLKRFFFPLPALAQPNPGVQNGIDAAG